MIDTDAHPVEVDLQIRRRILLALKDIADDLEIAGLEDLPAARELRDVIANLAAQTA